ncbi:MAG: homoserine O-succinyltransferase [Ruminococcaceae bacterium]|nr:homoserine O-succinyltransferase [Oscillospiraceae bacterium]
MPIKIPNLLPARETLENENIFVMNEIRAQHQDIRPLRIAILNLMPTKIVTETQILRLLSNTPLQIDITFLQTESYKSKNTSEEHLTAFYKNFSDVKDEKFDGLIITGAPVENLEFEEVVYWKELCEIMDWSRTNVHSSIFICWAAQAALYHKYGIPKYPIDQKMFGIFEHKIHNPSHPIVRGFDECFYAPHSRHSEVRREDILKCSKLEILSESDIAGVYMVAAKNNRYFFITGHPEYDYDTLSKEYFRDVDKGLDIKVPYNYFPGDNPNQKPVNKWRSHAHLLYSNWLNYFVYQETPFNINNITQE